MNRAQAPALRYLALGDSYTIGEGVDARDRWPRQLARALRAAGIPLQAPTTIAATGWTTDELDAAIDEHTPATDFDFASLLVGVNDQYRGRDVRGYSTAFDGLLARTIGFAGGRAARVLVLSIPDWGCTPFGAASGRDLARIASELDDYNALARAACLRHGVAFVDITPVSRALGNEAGMLAADGLHPSAAMYAEWTQRALPVVTRLLRDAA